MLRSIQTSLPTNLRPTMDLKFIFVLFLVEAGSLVFNSLDMGASELHVYNAYNEFPVITHVSSKPYSCFSNINYCIYGHKQLRFLQALDLIFISVIIICYGCLFVIILREYENIKIRPDLKITWYAGLELLVLFALVLHIFLTIILFERSTVNTNPCNNQNRLVRAQNLFNNFVLSIIEVAYIGFDLVNRQTSSVPILHQEFEHEAPAAQPLRLRSSENDYRIVRTWNQ